MAEVTLPHGTLEYRDTGTGEPIVLLHGFVQGPELWDPVVERLAGQFRCLAPHLPLGAHRIPMRAGADLTVPGVARLVADFLDALDLRDVTLVSNDTSTAVAQVVAARHPQRLGRLVLTGGEAFDNFPPAMFRSLVPLARMNALGALLAPLRIRALRGAPFAYGGLTRGRVPADLTDRWIGAYHADPGVRRDARAFTLGFGDRHLMCTVAGELARFTAPTLLVWGADDRFFPYEHAERLARILPDARVERVAGSRTWVMRDQPERTTDLIRDFVRNAHPTARSVIR